MAICEYKGRVYTDTRRPMRREGVAILQVGVATRVKGDGSAIVQAYVKTIVAGESNGTQSTAPHAEAAILWVDVVDVEALIVVPAEEDALTCRYLGFSNCYLKAELSAVMTVLPD
jgi:hypothetical protein